MRIGVDIRVLARGTYTGIEEYTRGLLEALIPLDPHITYCLFYNAFSRVDLVEPWLHSPHVELHSFRVPNRILDTAALVLQQPKIDRLLGGVDVFLSPHFLLTPLSRHTPRILVIHDLSFHMHPEYFSLRKKIWHAQMMPARQVAAATRVVAVSHATARDLQTVYGVPQEKIEVVHPGLSISVDEISDDPRRREKIRQYYRLPERFFLYFGTIEPRKNIGGLIHAFESLSPELHHWKLVLAGSLGWSYGDILKSIARSPRKNDIILPGFVRKEDKPYLYQLSSCFIYPSFFEGFGFPPLEAMQNGVPTITSHVASLPEVVGDAALLIDPYRVKEIIQAMEAVAQDRALQEMLRVRGRAHAARFSWRASAQKMLDIIREAATKN